MSTRWYPLYQKGNPQRRVFLPNFWLKLVKPEHNQPKNIVEFHCSMEMTKFDVRNYLEKIYNVHPVYVHTRIALGKTYIPHGCKFVVKNDDVKIAYVALVSIKEKKLNFKQKDNKIIVNTHNTHFI
ncbi:39S ribosomal protein L23, mitochondrial [Melipona quadrifasciata]|uniref:Large ribosomal subunit protein uL23m n=1 Tax=Melipona quadrifasciata TaxID=166423 RepID=A0A0N0U4B8_9HYME|nr:39S ribosomal protein L23, mitochondrial [Melipona quadrifasciata]